MPSNTTQTPPAVPTLEPGVFPLYLRAVQAVAGRQPDADEITQELLRQLDHNAGEGEGDDESRAVWTAAAALARKVLLERPGPLPLIEYTEILEEHAGTDWQALCAWCYMGASVDTGTAPRLAAALHMTVAEFLYTETHQRPEIYEEIILPWFTAYWTKVFADARFRFQAPRMVETELQAALASEPNVRLQRLLGVIGFGLDVALPDEGQEWFTRSR